MNINYIKFIENFYINKKYKYCKHNTNNFVFKIKIS